MEDTAGTVDTVDIADTVVTADTADTADTDATEAMVDTADMADTTDELTADHSSFIGSLIFKLIVSRSTFGLEYSGLTSNWISPLILHTHYTTCRPHRWR